MSNPKITVLMPVFNCEKYLRDAIESILNQTFADFELLIINDGSTDSTFDIIASYKDDRIKVIHNERNLGISVSRNRGIQGAHSGLIAIMDADDKSRPERLERQYAYFKTHPECSFLGSHYVVIDDEGVERSLGRSPLYHESILFHLCFGNCLAHSSMMFVKDAITALGGYDETLSFAEDYDLWARAMPRYKFAVIPQPLILYRSNVEGSASRRHSDKQIFFAFCASKKLLKALCPEAENVEDVLDLIYYSYSPHLSRELKKEGIRFLKYVRKRILRNASFSFKQRREMNIIYNTFKNKILESSESHRDSYIKYAINSAIPPSGGNGK